MAAGVQRHLDTGEADRRPEEGNQRQREPDESGSDATSHAPVPTERRAVPRPAAVWVSGVNASSRLGGRTTEWGGVWERNSPPHTPPHSVVRWEGSGHPILVCYIRTYIIILEGIFSLTSLPTKILGDVSPASPAGLTPVVWVRCFVLLL